MVNDWTVPAQPLAAVNPNVPAGAGKPVCFAAGIMALGLTYSMI